MSRVATTRMVNEERSVSDWHNLYTVGGIAALLQLASVVGIIVVAFSLGLRPATTEAYFAVVQDSALVALLRDDLFSLILIGLYLGTFPALYVALRRINPAATTLATLFTFVVVAGALASHTGLSMIHLGRHYAVATSATEQARLLDVIVHPGLSLFLTARRKSGWVYGCQVRATSPASSWTWACWW